MKTFARLIRRYVFAAVGLGLLLPALCIGLLVWLGWQTGQYMPQWAYSSGAIADSMVSTADGLTFGAEHTPQEWMDGYAWAMALDDDGNVFWHYNLPDLLNRRYAPTDVARFAHWYLADYPVFCWTEDYGLFVIALPQGSLWKYNFYSAPAVITHLIHSILPVCFGLLAIGLAVCFALSWRSARRLRTVSAGLDALADGQPVRLPTEGFTAELAEKLNQTSAHLQKQSEIIARRDQARTRWIAGVSHDVRTPLALDSGLGRTAGAGFRPAGRDAPESREHPRTERKTPRADRRSEPDQQAAIRCTAPSAGDADRRAADSQDCSENAATAPKPARSRSFNPTRQNMLSFGWTAPCWKGCWIICWATVSGTIRSLFKSGCKPTFPAAFSASWFRMTARVIRPTCSPRCMRRSPCPTPRTFSACMSWNRLPPRTAEALSSHRTRRTAQKPLCGFRWQGKTQVSDSIKNAPDSCENTARGTVIGIKKIISFEMSFQPGDSLPGCGLTRGRQGSFLWLDAASVRQL